MCCIQRQAWLCDHLHAARPEGGHAFSVSVALSDCEEAEASQFVVHNIGGLPQPWKLIPMPKAVGDGSAICLDIIHALLCHMKPLAFCSELSAIITFVVNQKSQWYHCKEKS